MISCDRVCSPGVTYVTKLQKRVMFKSMFKYTRAISVSVSTIWPPFSFLLLSGTGPRFPKASLSYVVR